MDDKLDKNKEVWDVPINTSFLDKSKKDAAYMDYKALALFTIFSARKSEQICKLLKIDETEAEQHRYITEKYIKSNMKEFEHLSGYSRKTILRNLNALAKAENRVFEIYTDGDGVQCYKITPFVNTFNEVDIKGTFVTIESDILRFLVNTSNNNVIKAYCFFKWFLIDYEYLNKTGEVKYTTKRIDRKFICKNIGLGTNSHKVLANISEDIEKYLCMAGLIKRTKQTYFKDGEPRIFYEYSMVSHDQWVEFLKKIGK